MIGEPILMLHNLMAAGDRVMSESFDDLGSCESVMAKKIKSLIKS
jgi:hypothetical protein